MFGDEKFLAKEYLPGKAQIISVYPNPAREPFIIKFYVPGWKENYYADIELVDLTGRKVSKIFSGTVESGIREIVMDKTQLTASGLYMVVLRCGAASSVAKVLFE